MSTLKILDENEFLSGQKYQEKFGDISSSSFVGEHPEVFLAFTP